MLFFLVILTELILQLRVISKQFQYITVNVMVRVMVDVYILLSVFWGGQEEGVHGRVIEEVTCKL